MPYKMGNLHRSRLTNWRKLQGSRLISLKCSVRFRGIQENSATVSLLRLYISTLRHLRPRQIFHLARQRLLPAARVQPGKVGLAQVRPELRLAPIMATPQTGCGDFEFRFLNVQRAFTLDHIDWACADMPKLWRYNLHYFDYLLDKGRSRESLADILSDWIEKNPPGCEDAWEPYTVSLRIVNWIKWFLLDNAEQMPPKLWLDSLYLQAAWLERNIEHHLLANHYLKNAKALFFAGAFFKGGDADRWLQKGLKILSEEVCEQILPDGGHHERSPMYHCIVVEDYLDVLNLSLTNPDLVDSECVGMLQQRVTTALDFLNDILAPDGQIPLFNDSAFGIAPTPDQLFNYASQLMQYMRHEYPDELCISAKPDSGYFVIRDSNDMLIVDCGLIGPDYQPGHAHCDTLSYELSLAGRRVIVDAGVRDYEAGEDREYARSTGAHNTVVVDKQEQSEVWGVFRVARRARPVQSGLDQLDLGRVRFEGAHDGYRRLAGKVTHQRVVEYEKSEGWWIRDSLLGSGIHHVESFIHLAPGLRVSLTPDTGSISIKDHEGVRIAEIKLPDNLRQEMIKGKYFPEFGVSEVNSVVRLSGDVELPFHTAYRICGSGALKLMHDEG